MADKIQIRRDTASNWTSANPTLAQGELGLETDTSKIKAGTGSTAWTSLGYYTLGVSGVPAASITGTISQSQLAAEAVDESKLQASNAPTNGYFLSAQSGNTGGLTWAEAGGDATGSSSVSTINAVTTTFTGIPAAVRTLRIIFDFVRSTANGVTVKLGDSGGIEASGYVGLGYTANSSTTSGATICWLIPLISPNDTNGAYGFMDITRVATGSNRWIQSGQALIYGSSGAISNFSGGSKTLSGELTQLQIGGGNGNNVTGNVTIVWGY